MPKHHKRKQPLEGDGRDHKKINRCDPVRVVTKKSLPSLRRPTSPRHHVFRDRRLGNIDAEFQQLTVDPGRTPERILKTDPPNEVANLLVYFWPPTQTTGFPSPVGGEAHPMPTHDGLWPDDRYGVKDARKATIKPNEQGPIGPSQIQPTWRTLPKHIQLMPQDQNLGFKPPS
jgi:hypothetical protein